MIGDLTGNAYLCSNPHHIKDDEHGGNKIGIADVLGVDALSRTTSCDFHYDNRTKVHKKPVRKCDRKIYKKIALELRNSVTPEGYKAALQKMKDLIQMQRDGDQKSLLDALEFWNKVRPRWATAFKSVIHGASRSSLAEVACPHGGSKRERVVFC